MRQRLLLLCICVGSYLSGIAQPANDLCSAAIVITNLDGTCTTALDITNATPDIAASACTAGSNEPNRERSKKQNRKLLKESFTWETGASLR